MARKKIEARQGATTSFTVRWPGVDLTAYSVRCAVRLDYASDAVAEVTPDIFQVTLIEGDETDGIVYGAEVDDIVDSVQITWGADLTELLENQSNEQKSATHVSDVLLIHDADPDTLRMRPALFDVYVIPQVTR